MKHLMDLNINEFESYLEELGEKKFVATQIFEWLYIHREKNVDNFTNIRIDLREKLKNDFNYNFINIKKIQSDSDVKKYLFELSDGELIEAVLMMHNYGDSVCISSQVGCNMGCKFCESGILKKKRNLEIYEMVEQILLIEEDINKKINSVVVMGIGEPFDNYDNVTNFIKIINHNKAFNIGARHITVSTCGLVPKIKDFSDFPLQVNLAISLHASTDEIRDKIMPINKVYKIKDVIEAMDEYIKKTNRRVTIEYVMINMVNDSDNDAKNLVSLLKGKNVYVNLIPYNETSHIEYKKSNNIERFKSILLSGGIDTTVRREFGSGISAACGQLRSSEVIK